MKDFLELICILVGALTIIALLIGVPTYFISKYECSVYAEMLQLEHKHSIVTGCMIKAPPGWIKSTQYFINKEEK